MDSRTREGIKGTNGKGPDLSKSSIVLDSRVFHLGEVYPPTGFGKRPVNDSYVLCYLYPFSNFRMSWTLVIFPLPFEGDCIRYLSNITRSSPGGARQYKTFLMKYFYVVEGQELLGVDHYWPMASKHEENVPRGTKIRCCHSWCRTRRM